MAIHGLHKIDSFVINIDSHKIGIKQHLTYLHTGVASIYTFLHPSQYFASMHVSDLEQGTLGCTHDLDWHYILVC